MNVCVNLSCFVCICEAWHVKVYGMYDKARWISCLYGWVYLNVELKNAKLAYLDPRHGLIKTLDFSILAI